MEGRHWMWGLSQGVELYLEGYGGPDDQGGEMARCVLQKVPSSWEGG